MGEETNQHFKVAFIFYSEIVSFLLVFTPHSCKSDREAGEEQQYSSYPVMFHSIRATRTRTQYHHHWLFGHSSGGHLIRILGPIITTQDCMLQVTTRCPRSNSRVLSGTVIAPRLYALQTAKISKVNTASPPSLQSLSPLKQRPLPSPFCQFKPPRLPKPTTQYHSPQTRPHTTKSSGFN